MPTRRYQHSIPPEDYTKLLEYIERELSEVSASIDSLANGVFDVRASAPTRVYPGMVVVADGTNWQPGGSTVQGLYLYTQAGTWVLIGPYSVALAALTTRVATLEAQYALLPFKSPVYKSTAQVYAAATLITLAHGLPYVPTHFATRMRCTTAQSNWAVNDETNTSNSSETGAASYGIQIYADATNLYIRPGSGGIQMNNKTTGASFVLTPANWRLLIEAY